MSLSAFTHSDKRHFASYAPGGFDHRCDPVGPDREVCSLQNSNREAYQVA
jgi:hypothetical protein